MKKKMLGVLLLFALFNSSFAMLSSRDCAGILDNAGESFCEGNMVAWDFWLDVYIDNCL